MPTGRIDKIVPARGFGFIRNEITSKTTFFHVSECPQFEELQLGDAVEYEIESNVNDGRPEARNVKLVAAP